MRANTDWFRDCKWGVICHFLADGAPGAGLDKNLTVEQWNEKVNAFDVNGLADQLAYVGASYYFLTVGQNSGFYCSPNATYDSYVGIQPSKCSTRDLVADLYDALHAKGIELLVYMPSGAPERDLVAVEALEWEPSNKYPDIYFPNGLPEGVKPSQRLVGFQRKWEAVIKEWSLRWGQKIRGWWFDGCYSAKAMYRHDDEPNFKSLVAAAKAGNPESIVAFNPGVITPVICYTEYEDYTAGEISDALPVWSKYCEVGKSRFVDGAQYHLLSFLGEAWGAGKPRFSDELIAEYTKFVNSYDGVMTWDVPIRSNGLIHDEFLKQLEKINIS